LLSRFRHLLAENVRRNYLLNTVDIIDFTFFLLFFASCIEKHVTNVDDSLGGDVKNANYYRFLQLILNNDGVYK